LPCTQHPSHYLSPALYTVPFTLYLYHW
jgi:hypothetical protein